MLFSAILFSTIAMVSYGVGNAVLKIPTARIGVIESLIFRNCITVPVLLVAWFALGATLPTSIVPADILGGLVVAILGYAPFYLFLRALKEGEVGTVVPVTSARIIVSVLFGMVFLGDLLTRVDVFGIIGIVVGVVLVTLAPATSTGSFMRWLVPALGAALLWGVLYPLFGYYSGIFGALFYALCIEVAVLVGGLSHSLMRNSGTRTLLSDFYALDRRLIVALVVAGFLTAIGSLTFNLGYLTGEVGIVSAIGGASAVPSALAAVWLFRERISIVQWVGTILVVGCIALIALQ